MAEALYFANYCLLQPKYDAHTPHKQEMYS